MTFHEGLTEFSKIWITEMLSDMYILQSIVMPLLRIAETIIRCCCNHTEMVDSWLEKYEYSTNNQAAFIACIRQY